MDAHLRAGVAVFNAGGHHAAHDAWEEPWLDLEDGSDDERFLHGLIQFTAAVHHVDEGNPEGAVGLAESAGGYLEGLASPYRGVDLEPVRAYLRDLAEAPAGSDPEPPALAYEGGVLELDDLDVEAALVAAEVLADEFEIYDDEVVRDAVSYARDAVAAGRDSRFVGLVTDFVVEAEYREVVYDRMVGHVERRRAEESDVDGLFET